MACFILTIRKTKARVNSKKWGTANVSVGKKPDYDEQFELLDHGVIAQSPKLLVTKLVVGNCPEAWNAEDFKNFWSRVFVFTPFGVPKYEHDYREVIELVVPGKSYSYTIIKPAEECGLSA